MINYKSQFLHAILFLAIVVLLAESCKKNEDPPPPDLLPETTFFMDFADFSDPDDTLSQRGIVTYKNWGHAFIEIAVWNTFLKTALAIPFASFAESFKHAAVYHSEENSWVWIYTFKSLSGDQFIAELTAYHQNENVIWEMRISKDNHYDNFLWYSGLSTPDQSMGYWILNENPEQPNPIIRIDWIKNDNESGGIQYTNIKDGSAEKDSYISYGFSIGDLDRYYRIYTMRYDNISEIEWNHTDFYGRIKNAWTFEDNEWHCWDTNLQDASCK